MSMNFGEALATLKAGHRIARNGWNGKGMWLAYVDPTNYHVADAIGRGLSLRPWIGIKTIDDQFMPWLASQSDMLQTDWVVVT